MKGVIRSHADLAGITVDEAGALHRTVAGSGTAETASRSDHTHDASIAFNGGTVPTARLGSGSATGTTFLRGDSTWATPGGAGVGDVSGPASSTDNALARFDGTTGKLLQNSGATLSDAGSLVVADVTAKIHDLGGAYVDVTAYGATGDGSTDDTAAVLAALAVCHTTGAALYFPEGSFVLSGAGTEILLVTKSIRIFGAGMGRSILKIAASVGASTDVIRYNPTAASGAQSFGFAVTDLGGSAVSGTPGRHWIHIDIEDPIEFAMRAMIERNDFRQIGGWGVHVSNSTLKIPAFLANTIRDNRIAGGLRLNGVADSNLVDNNVLYGTNVGVEIEMVANAANLMITRNNITNVGGGIWVKRCIHPIVRDNYFEAQAALSGGSGNSAYLDLAGASAGAVNSTDIVGNQISVLTAAGVVDGVRVANATNTNITRNQFFLQNASSWAVRLTTGASGSHVGDNAFLTGNAGGNITNSSDTTLQVYPATPSAFPAAVSQGAAWWTGPAKFQELNLHVGSAIASAATIAPAAQAGNVFTVSGTTTIDTITARRTGDVLVLIPSGAWALGSSGNVVATPGARIVNETVVLVYNGTSWFEASRPRVPRALTLYGARATWTSMPAAATQYLGQVNTHVTKLDLTDARQVRLTVMVGTAGTAGAIVYAQHSTDGSSYSNNTAASGFLSVSLASGATLADSGWMDIASTAQGDVWLRLAGSGGDGVTSPVLGTVVFLYR
jgi:hypothetical protein